MKMRNPAAACLAGYLFLTILATAATSDPDALKRKVDLLGHGAQVKLKLADGKKLRGQLSGIEQDAFLLAPAKESEHSRIEYANVALLQPAKNHYRAAGVPDAAEARRAVIGLGEGHHVMVRLAGDRVLRGHIGSIEPGQFALLPDGGAAAVAIDYGDIHHIRKNPATSTIIIIAVGAALATMLLVFWAIREHNE